MDTGKIIYSSGQTNDSSVESTDVEVGRILSSKREDKVEDVVPFSSQSQQGNIVDSQNSGYKNSDTQIFSDTQHPQTPNYSKVLRSIHPQELEPDLREELYDGVPMDTVSDRAEDMDTLLNSQIYDLVVDYSDELMNKKKSFIPIHVDEIASRLARFYETIRKIVDWKDDSVLRRGAIERVLKRVLFPKMAGITMQEIQPYHLAETVTTELIRGGHLPNDTIPSDRIRTVAEALNKYLYFMEYAETYKAFEVKKKVNFTTFVLEIASCEVEEILTNPVKEYGIIQAMTQILNERLNVSPKDKITEEQKIRYLFIAVCRTLYDLDDNFITYRLLKNKYPNWHDPDEQSIKQISKELPSIWKNIQEELEVPVAKRFSALAERVDTVFMLIDDVLEELKEHPKTILKTFENKKQFRRLVTKAYEKRYKTLKRRLFRLAIFSTLSVFLSNWFTFYIIEVPLAKLFYEGWSLSAAIMDFLIPTVLMFFLVIIIRPPRRDNVKKVMKATLGFVYNDEGWEYYQIKLKSSRPSLFQVVISAIYIYTMILVFAGIGYVFYVAHLPITSVVFDTFTIALTVFAAVTIKNKARELNVDEHSSVQDFIMDIISVPVAKVGSLFAAKWKEYNVIAIFFNFVVETPFALILDFIQGWSEFIRERRSELH